MRGVRGKVYFLEPGFGPNWEAYECVCVWGGELIKLCCTLVDGQVEVSSG